MEHAVRSAIEKALTTCFPDIGETKIEVEVPRDSSHGDYSTNIAMTLTKSLKRAPRDIAGTLQEELSKNTALFQAVEVAGPGFLNVRMAPAELYGELKNLLDRGDAFGRSDAGQNKKVMVEFVSANPTGPLNVVNARAAAFGGALARLLAWSGYDAVSEFYVNDVGGQIDLLGQSFLARYRQAQGKDAEIPEQGYQGEYLADLARALVSEGRQDPLQGKPEEKLVEMMARIAVDRMCAWQKEDLRKYGTEFDTWFHQRDLYPDAVLNTAKLLIDAGLVEEREGAQWFLSTQFGDDQDRVIVRNTGEPTYFLADLAYHANKHDRGVERSIDVWGPDHHGYIARMQAGMEALGYGKDWLEVVIVQQVNLLSEGKPVKMSKRKGEFITLADLIGEVGKDAAIFFFLQRRAESHLDFDMDLARQESEANPVFYVKYAHARIASLLRKAKDEGAQASTEHVGRLEEKYELDLLKVMLRFPELIASAAKHREPHRLTGYLRDVSSSFHLFYHHCRVLGEDKDLTSARLALSRGAQYVLANGLAIMDIEAPERM